MIRMIFFFAFSIFILSVAQPVASFEFKTNPYDFVLAHDGKKYKQFKDLDLSGKDFSGKTLQNIAFFDCNFENANFSGANLTAVSFTRSSLDGSNFKGATLINSWVGGSNIDFENVKVYRQKDKPNIRSGSGFTAIIEVGENVNLKNAFLDGGYLSGYFKNTTFYGMVLKNGTIKMDEDIIQSKFDNVKIENSIVWDLNLSNMKVKDVEITNSRLSSCIFQGMKAKKFNMSGSEMSHLNFNKATIKNGNFSGVESSGNQDFSEAKLIANNFSKAKISGSTFENADLRKINFTDAKLKWVKFDGADISNGDFTGAEDLDSCTFLGAKTDGTKS